SWCLPRRDAASGDPPMTRSLFAASIKAAAAAALVFAGHAAAAAPSAGDVILAPHRAIYDLKLVRSSGTRGIESVRGRILYDFSGSACEGYTLDFRQVSQLYPGEGDPVLSDLTSTTWENGAA